MAKAAPDRRATAIRASAYSILLPIPVLSFIGALVSDLAYQGSGGNLLWLDFSDWLLAAGMLFGALAGLVLLIELLREPALREGTGWLQFGLLLAAWIVELINSLVHARDGWTAVVPTGLILSAVGVILVLASGWLWHSFRYPLGGVRP